MPSSQPTIEDCPDSHAHAVERASSSIPATDGELLMRFARHRDERAFAQLVDNHAALVWAVCQQVLHQHEDIEDAFQATFLILARRAKDIRASDSAAGWLYRVAHRTSLSLWRRNKARTEERLNGHDVAVGDDDPLERLHERHSISLLLEELRALPRRYQEPIVLCYLEGRTRSAAADTLDVTTATIKGRLARGRRMLRSRLARRGVALSIATGTVAAAVQTADAAVSVLSIAPATAAAASSFVSSGMGATGSASTTATSLAQQGVSAMFYATVAKPTLSLITAVAVGLGVVLASDTSSDSHTHRPSDLILLASADGDAKTDADIGAESRVAAPKPTASTAGSEDTKVLLELKSVNGKDDVIVLRGDKQAVERSMKQLNHRLRVQLPNTTPHPTPGMNYPAAVQELPIDTPSVEQLEMELKYWELRIKGLELKNNAAEERIERLRALTKAGAVSATEADTGTDEAGEIMLRRADIYQAKAKMLEIERRIERQKQMPKFADPMPTPTAPAMPGNRYGTPPAPYPAQAPANYSPQPAPGATSEHPWLVQPLTNSIPQPVIPPGGARPALLSWKTDIDEALQDARRTQKPVLVHFVSTARSAPCREFQGMVNAHPDVQRFIKSRFHPVKIEVADHPAITQAYRINRVPTVVVLNTDGQKMLSFVAPQDSGEYLARLVAAVPQYQPQPSNEPTPSFLPGEVVKITITKEKPHGEESQYRLRINEGGYINVPGTNLVCRIAGAEEKASKKILDELRAFHGDYFNEMGVDVKVERMKDEGANQVLPPPTTAFSAPQIDLDEVVELKRKFEALRKEHAKLKEQLDTTDRPK